MKKIVVIGGSAAGAKFSAKCKRLMPDSSIQLYTEENIISYSSCGLPYYIEGIIDDINKLIIRTPDDFRQAGIEVYTNHKCSKIIKEKKIVIINNKEIPYDELVLATGSIPKILHIKNNNLDGVFTLKNIRDGYFIKEKLKTSKRMVIIGGGYIALELLEAFRANNIEVFMIESKTRIMSDFDTDFSLTLESHILNDSSGLIHIIKNTTVLEILGEKHFEGVLLSNGEKIMADFCVLATGVEPNTELAKSAGIKLGHTGAIKVNCKMRTSEPNIWAIGDCTEKHCQITKIPVYAPSGSTANKEGRLCAINVAGGNEIFKGVLCSSVTKYFDFTIARVGLTLEKALEFAKIIDIEPIEATVVKSDRAGYMPKSQEIMVRLVVDRRTREILGAQAAGLGDADKRVNVIVASINSNLTIDDFINLDLTYAPPYGIPIDSLLECAYKIKKEIETN